MPKKTGRTPPNFRWTPEKIRDARILLANGATLGEVGEFYEVKHQRISSVVGPLGRHAPGLPSILAIAKETEVSWLNMGSESIRLAEEMGCGTVYELAKSGAQKIESAATERAIGSRAVQEVLLALEENGIPARD